ncbi:MAG TPA: hemolysin III family protein [Labilithrix sp.]|jgi:hemolysin III
MNAASVPVAAAEKPLLRGVLHQYAFFVALACAYALVRSSHTPAAMVASGVFGASLATLFATSALYHRVAWGAEGRRLMRRLDHAAIFVLIAGGYTPLFTLVPSSKGDHVALVVIWTGAALGIVKSLVWAHAPKWLTALLCVALGWVVIGQVIDRKHVVGALCISMLVASGALYSVGAIVYALRKPNPFPRVFGYHEVFHAFTIVASACLVAHALLVIRAVG